MKEVKNGVCLTEDFTFESAFMIKLGSDEFTDFQFPLMGFYP